jgi:hypothetical protein
MMVMVVVVFSQHTHTHIRARAHAHTHTKSKDTPSKLTLRRRLRKTRSTLTSHLALVCTFTHPRVSHSARAAKANATSYSPMTSVLLPTSTTDTVVYKSAIGQCQVKVKNPFLSLRVINRRIVSFFHDDNMTSICMTKCKTCMTM